MRYRRKEIIEIDACMSVLEEASFKFQNIFRIFYYAAHD